MGRPRRKEIEIESTRRHIMNAAVEVFARKGFAAATMQDIAAEAEYSAPSLYSYFKGKKAILEALLVTLRDESTAMFQAPMPRGLTLAQKLELLLRPMGVWTDANRAAFVFLTRREGLGLMPESDLFAKPRAARLFIDWFTAHSTAEERRGHSAETAGWLLYGLTHGMFVRWLATESHVEAGARTTEAIDFFLGALGARAGEG